MDLTLFFSAVDESLYENITSPSSFFKNIRAYTDKIPDFREAHMALVGLPALERLKETLFAGEDPTKVYYQENTIRVVQQENNYSLELYLPHRLHFFLRSQ